MTVTAEHVLQEIQTLPAADLRQVWVQLGKRLAELNLSAVTTPAEVSEEEFQAALDELTGCTTGSSGTDLLLAERRRDCEQEQAELEAYLVRRHHG